MKKIAVGFFINFSIIVSFSQEKSWNLMSKNNHSFIKENIRFKKSVPSNYQIYSLDFNTFKNDIRIPSKGEKKIIELPTHTGVQLFYIQEASSLSSSLSKNFPMISSYVAQGVEDPSLIARLSLGTDGLHAVIYSANKNSFYIDSYTKDNNAYIGYNKKDASIDQSSFKCKVNEAITTEEFQERSNQNSGDTALRIYRLALASTGEYAEFHIDQQGVATGATDAVKKAAVLSAMNTTITRVNGVFEKDLGVRLEIIANNDAIIFLDGLTDNLTNNDEIKLIKEIQGVIDSKIGNSNYDIGHVFSTGDDAGVASGSSVCVRGEKSQGVTGRKIPVGDAYDIDFVIHEIGHQFGATHTQNNSCGRYNQTAVEPGSASTIMGYAGICEPNVQSNSDDYFHSVNINQIWNYITTSSGSCSTTTDTGNNPPTVDAGPDYFIPKSTPFVLKGTGTDPDANNIPTYSWEQTDSGTALMPPASSNKVGPMFRAHPPSSSPERYMPALSTIIEGNISSIWEVLPSVGRTMNFSLIVRDNNLGGGNTRIDNMKVTVDENSGPFVITSPNEGTQTIEWAGNSIEKITWNVANTSSSPINCQTITILLSTDNGKTFDEVLLEDTPNDGEQEIIVPNKTVAQARIMIRARNNIFYTVNHTPISIQRTTVKEGFNVFPNPSINGKITVSLKGITSNKKITIGLYNILGQLIEEETFNKIGTDFLATLRYKKIAKGLYLLKVTSGENEYLKKIIVD